MEDTLSQPYLFAAAVYLGIAAALLYAAIRALFRLMGGGRGFVIAADALFLLLLFAVSALCLQRLTHLKVREYTYAGIAAGFALQWAVLHPFAKMIQKKWRDRPKRGKSGGKGT